MTSIVLSQFIIGLKGIVFCEHGNKPRGSIHVSNVLPIWVRISFSRKSLRQGITKFLFEFRTQTQQNSGPLTLKPILFFTERSLYSVPSTTSTHFSRRLPHKLYGTDININNNFLYRDVRNLLHYICFPFRCKHNPSTSKIVNGSAFA